MATFFNYKLGPNACHVHFCMAIILSFMALNNINTFVFGAIAKVLELNHKVLG